MMNFCVISYAFSFYKLQELYSNVSCGVFGCFCVNNWSNLNQDQQLLTAPWIWFILNWEIFFPKKHFNSLKFHLFIFWYYCTRFLDSICTMCHKFCYAFFHGFEQFLFFQIHTLSHFIFHLQCSISCIFPCKWILIYSLCHIIADRSNFG